MHGGKGIEPDCRFVGKKKVLNPTAYKQREGRKTPHQTPENEVSARKHRCLHPRIRASTQAARSNSRPIPSSIWDKKQRENPMENRKVFYNTHPAIISLKSLIRCRRSGSSGIAERQRAKTALFSVQCSHPMTASKKLYYSTTSYFEKRQDFFICSTHRINKDKCSGHYIRAVVAGNRSSGKHIQEVISVVTRYEAYFRSEMEQKLVYRRNRCGCIKSDWHRLGRENRRA